MWGKFLEVSEIALLSLFLGSAPGFARDFNGVPEDQVLSHEIAAPDGTRLKITQFSNPGRPILLMEPGLGAQAHSLERPATFFHQIGGFEVYIGDWRGAARLKDGSNGLSAQRNGLEEVVRHDFPAHLEFVLSRANGPVRLFGHSMGGMMIAGTLSDPELYQKFRPHLHSAVLFQSPHHVKHLLPTMKMLARAGGRLIPVMQEQGIRSIDLHSRLLSASHQSKKKGGWAGRWIAPAIESLAILLVRIALSPAHTGREYVRRAFFKMGAFSIALDLLKDFVGSVNGDGNFYDSRKEKLIKPEDMGDLPFQLVRTRLDTLAPWLEQMQYFQELVTPVKQLLSVDDMNHIDSVLATREEVQFFEHVLEFYMDPKGAAVRNPHLRISPRCESVLQRLALKVRFRGI